MGNEPQLPHSPTRSASTVAADSSPRPRSQWREDGTHKLPAPVRGLHGGSNPLTDHVVGHVDLDLSLVLEGHLALDALVCLFLFGNPKRKELAGRRDGGREEQRRELLEDLAQDSPERLWSLPGLLGPFPSHLLLSPALQPGAKGVGLRSRGELLPASPGEHAPSQGAGTQQNHRKDAEGGWPAQCALIHLPILHLPIRLFTHSSAHLSTYPPPTCPSIHKHTHSLSQLSTQAWTHT